MHVLDASKSVPVAMALLGDNRANFADNVRSEYVKIRENNAKRRGKKTISPLSLARENTVKFEWENYSPVTPAQLGVQVLKDYPLDEILECFDWTPFFKSWQLAGKYPDILEDQIVGEEATKLFNDAQTQLKNIIEQKWLQCSAVFGLFPANGIDGDSTEIYVDESRSEVQETLHHLRQQTDRPIKKPYRSLADFVAPKDSGVKDYMGAFALSCFGAESMAEEYEANLDDYNAIMIKALADRFAEAFAELLHEKIRKHYWGYAATEDLSNEALIKESYQGIRPAPGYPACPEHTEKGTLWKLLDPDENIGTCLTENFAMAPAASVSGWYFSHPEALYFGLGKIGQEQVEDYAQRKGMPKEEAEKWLRPNLA